MSETPMTLIERLNNPQWAHEPNQSPALNVERTVADMAIAASELTKMRAAIEGYLAGSYSCNGGAEALFSPWSRTAP